MIWPFTKGSMLWTSLSTLVSSGTLLQRPGSLHEVLLHISERKGFLLTNYLKAQNDAMFFSARTVMKFDIYSKRLVTD